MLIKGAIHQKDIPIVNIDVMSISVPKFTKHILEHKASLNKYMEIEIIYCILSN
jgi:hypothetical protein